MTTIATEVPIVPATPVKKTVVRRRVTAKAVANVPPPLPVETAPVVTSEAIPPVKEIRETLGALVTPTIPVQESFLTGNDEVLNLAEEPTDVPGTPPPLEGGGARVVATKKRVVKGANKERLFEEFEKLYETLDKLLVDQNLKGVLKDLKSVRDLTYRLLKLKTGERQKRDSTNSGFMKPVRISAQLEGFLQKNGFYKPELTRAYLTTVMCSYIKAKQLQNPADRRIILPDADLQVLFNITDSSTEPLTYYTLQKRIQSHIFKTTVEV